MKRTLQDMELRSESVQAVMTDPPAWIVRYGITVIFGMLLILLGVSYFISYPDVIEASATITSENPPQRLEAKINSRIARLIKTEPVHVKKGELLAVLESSANPDDVLLLNKALLQLNDGKTEALDQLGHLSLGSIQPAYTAFRKSYLERNLDSRLKPFEQEIATGRVSEQENQSRLASLYAQQKLEGSKLELSEQQLKRAQELFNKGVISATDFGQQKTFALQARQAYDQITLSISQQREAISRSRRQLSDGQKSKEKSEATGKSTVTLAMDELHKSIADWESEHLLYAPADGSFALQGSWRENQSVKSGDVIATLMPDAQSQVWGALTVAATNSGKITRGQKVLLRLDNYPYQEFGSVSGKVVAMSPLPDTEGHYFVTVALPKGLLTSYGKKIRFSRELSGNAQIITDDMRLLDRFFYRLVKRVGR